jgi:hypothetical protein
MDERPLALLHEIALADQCQCRQSLDQACRCLAWLDAGRDLDRFGGRRGSVLCVRTAPEPGNVVTCRQAEDVTWAYGDDGAFRLVADDFGLWGWVEPGAEVAVVAVLIAFVKLGIKGSMGESYVST